MTTIADLPKEIVRPCCPGKSCGMVILRLEVAARLANENTVTVICGYKRDNDDWYFGPVDSLDELLKMVEATA